MSCRDAKKQAREQSAEYRTTMFVVQLIEDKKYSVVSEERYSKRGLEDEVVAIYKDGDLIA